MLNNLFKLIIVSSLSFLPLSLSAAEQVVVLTPGSSTTINNVQVTCRQSEISSLEEIANRIQKVLDLKADFCDQLYLDSDKEKCLSIKTKFLSQEALGICKGIYLDSNKIACLAAIKDKVYGTKEISIIKNIYLDSEKISKLKTSGQEI